MENSIEFPQKIKNRTTIWLSNSTSGYLSEKNENTNLKNNLHPHIHVFMAAVFTIAKIEMTGVSISAWLDKEWIKKSDTHIHTHMHAHIHTMEHYSTIKKNGILPFVTWMNLEGIMLIKVKQRKTNTMWFHLYVESEKRNNSSKN